MLSDSPYGPDIPKMYGDPTQQRRLGGLVGAIDIQHFIPLDRFFSRVSELVTRWCSLPSAQPNGQVLFPGQPELHTRRQRLREGVPLGMRLVKELEQLAVQYGMKNSLERAKMPDRDPTWLGT